MTKRNFETPSTLGGGTKRARATDVARAQCGSHSLSETGWGTSRPAPRSFGTTSRRLVGLLVVVAVASFIGCQKPAPPADLSNTPWLDPQAQLEGLKNSDFRIRGISAFNLGNIGAKAAEALPELERLAASDPEPKVRENAREAIEKIKAASGPPER